MSRIHAMSYLTGNGLDPIKAVEMAAAAGYDRIGHRFLPAGPGDVPPPFMTDDQLLADVKSAMADHGIAMSDVEMIRMNADTDPESYRAFFERCQHLGARHVLIAGDDPDRARIIDTYARLCDLAWEHGLTADLEFMPWTAIKNIADARELVEAANHPAAAILFDTLHFDRSDSTLDDIADLPREMLNYVQICDGPVPYGSDDAELIRIARTARLVPGEGGIDLAAIFARLPADVPVSVEVVNVEMARDMGPKALATRSLQASRPFTETPAP